MDFYENIIGYENIKDKLNTLADYIKNPAYYDRFHTKPQSNILLYGVAGTGKSSMALGFIRSAGLPHYTVRKQSSQKEFAEELKQTVDKAIKTAPCVLFLDDMDKYVSGNYDDEYDFIQTHIDNISDSGKQVYIIATSNDASMMPASLERRFNMIPVSQPSREDSVKIVKYYIGLKGFAADDLNFDDIIRLFSFKSCAEIETVISDAAVLAAMQRKSKVDMSDLITVFLKQNKITSHNIEDSVNDDDLYQICLHEAGHIVGLLANDKRGIDCFAYSIANHPKDKEPTGLVARYYNHSGYESHIIELLAAPMAVSEFLAVPDIGSEKDYETAIDIIYDNTNVVDSNMRCVRPERVSKNSNDYQCKVENVVHYELERYKWLARDIIHKNRDFVEELAQALYEKHYLLYSDVQSIAGRYEIVK